MYSKGGLQVGCSGLVLEDLACGGAEITASVTTLLLLKEPFPCNRAGETFSPASHLVCLKPIFPRVLFSGVFLFTDTGSTVRKKGYPKRGIREGRHFWVA